MFDEIIELNRRLFYDIWNLADTSPNSIRGLSPKLIIPRKRNQSNRISEQEARFLYTALLNSFNYYYSVETPTEEVYIQSGKKPISAASDLSLYKNENSTLKKFLNIEFKAHNPSKNDIKKDIEKLLRENVPGCWIHLLKNVDSKTIPILFKKFKESIAGISDKKNNSRILFSICIMEKNIGIQKIFDASKNDNLDNFFEFKYSIVNGDISIQDENDWII